MSRFAPPRPDEATDAVLALLVEELTDRLQAGEAVDLEAYIGQHPERAEELRRLLPALELLAVAGSSPDGHEPCDEAGAEGQGLVRGVLGDFLILREVGRGGMGVVYEAEQVSLNRRVALKVLPLAGALDERALQRFRNEARAAACLHHTNIVPVFAVGSERGVHFYAMQFIDGRPLSELIREMRQVEERKPAGAVTPPEARPAAAGEPRTTDYQASPGEPGAATPTVRANGDATPLTGQGKRGQDYFRMVAELGVQAAEALEHAHQVGVVHRDVKPANLLLDGRGNLWVADFGLAHVQHGEASLTMTGDLVGTLRYMSPEQALAKRVLIDHRTDVYSLGATLYELLTLRPAVRGRDRQEVLRQIAFEEPPPPRRLNRSVPAELEVVVLKALEKSPAERYATAQELADDLRRWLDDKPIRARRPSWRQVAAKWARRHRAVVWAAAVVLLVAGVLGAGFEVWRLQQRAAAECEAEVTLQDADRLQQEEKWPEALFTIRRAEPLLNTGLLGEGLRQRVEERLEDLKMVDRLEQGRLDRAAVKDGHFDLAQADPAYAQAFRDYGIDVTALGAEAAGRIRARGVRVELAAALDDWADVCRGTRHKGDMTWKRLLALARAADPDEMRNRLREALERSDAKALKGLATPGVADKLPSSTLVLLGRNVAATGAKEQGVAVLREGQRRHPGNFWVNAELARLLWELGPSHGEEDLRYFTVAVALRPFSAGTHFNLGVALSDKGQLEEGIAEFREAIRLKKDFAGAHSSLGNALKDKGQLDEAIAECREAIRLKKEFAGAHSNLGNALLDKGQLDEAIAEYREAIRFQKDYANAHCGLGNALHDKGQLVEAIAEFREAIRLKKDFPIAHCGLGIALHDKGQPEEAIVEFREAIRLNKDYADAHNNLGGALLEKGQLEEAIVEFREAIRLKKDYADARNNLGAALQDKGQLEEAIAEFREAIRLNKDYADAHNNLGGALLEKGQLEEAIVEFREAIRLKKDFPIAHYNLGNALRDKGQLEEAIAEFREAIRLKKDFPMGHSNLQQAEQQARLYDRLSAVLDSKAQPKDASERLAFAQLCQQQFRKRHAAAARFYDAAFAEKPQLADDMRLQHRYNAACAAVLAGCGQGKDAEKLDTKERARFREQALDWLRADLKAYRQVMDKTADKAGPDIAPRMQHWLQDPDFTSVRGPAALGRLPEAERGDWQKLWEDVETLRQRAAKPAERASPARP